MAIRQRWSALSRGTRRLILVGAAIEATLKIAALVDMKRRPASEIRGPKLAWASLVVLVNSAGAMPLAYFRFGRRPH